MGAQLWYHFSGPHDLPEHALREIQSKALANYDLPSLIQEHLDSMKAAVKACKKDDQYGLLDYYQDEVAKLKKLAAVEMPSDVEGQLKALRLIYDSSGEGIGNVLDVTGVSNKGSMHVTRLCSEDQLQDLIGVSRPTQAEAEQSISPVNERLGRGDSVCFQIYSDDRSRPIGWYFIGNTID